MCTIADKERYCFVCAACSILFTHPFCRKLTLSKMCQPVAVELVQGLLVVLYCFREGSTHVGSMAVFTGGKVENVNCNVIVTIIVCPLTR